MPATADRRHTGPPRGPCHAAARACLIAWGLAAPARGQVFDLPALPSSDVLELTLDAAGEAKRTAAARANRRLDEARAGLSTAHGKERQQLKQQLASAQRVLEALRDERFGVVPWALVDGLPERPTVGTLIPLQPEVWGLPADAGERHQVRVIKVVSPQYRDGVHRALVQLREGQAWLAWLDPDGWTQYRQPGYLFHAAEARAVYQVRPKWGATEAAYITDDSVRTWVEYQSDVSHYLASKRITRLDRRLEAAQPPAGLMPEALPATSAGEVDPGFDGDDPSTWGIEHAKPQR